MASPSPDSAGGQHDGTPSQRHAWQQPGDTARKRGDHGQDAGVTGEGLIPGRRGRHGGRPPGDALQQRGAARCRCVTHVLVGPGAEAAVGAALHQAALTHPLLPQQHHLGVHPPPAHPRAAAAAGRGRTGRGGAGTERGGAGSGRGVPEVRRAGRKRAAGRGARAAWRPPSRRWPERRRHGEILRQPGRPQGALGPGVRRLLAALPQPLQVRSGPPRPPAPFRHTGPTGISATLPSSAQPVLRGSRGLQPSGMGVPHHQVPSGQLVPPLP